MPTLTFQNLLIAYYSCRRHKRVSRSAGLFEFSFEKELLKLEQELQTHNYKPSKYSCFAITDPKLREVWVADFRDRIVHHLLINFIEPIFEKKFIFHSYIFHAPQNNYQLIYVILNGALAE